MTTVFTNFLNALRKYPFHVLLLPLFFILHGVKENFGFILIADVTPLILLYCFTSIFTYLVFLLLYRQQPKAGLITFCLFSIFFFYGAIQDFLKDYFPVLNRYVILIPVFFMGILIAAILVKRSTKKFTKITFFLNCLLLIYLVADIIVTGVKIVSPANDKFTTSPIGQNNHPTLCKDCTKPDIYFLVFDEYASSACLKNDFGFNNSLLDSFLIKKQFRIQKKSSGNYNFTPFSISSILNMSYINGINPGSVTSDDYARCNKLIRENEVVKYLSATGYDIINYSIFDIAGNPSPVNQDFLPLKAKLITDRTLWGRVKRDILWNLFAGRFEIKWLTRDAIYVYNNNNNKQIDLVKKESEKKSAVPRFIYAHYNLPHPPYYFDKNGNPVDKEKLGHSFDGNKSLYLDYVQYTNTKIEELVNTISANSNGQAVIIVMGDHGFRNDDKMPEHVFLQNQNAVYLPGRNYNLYYDSITGVNQFRVLINTLFKQKMPLLKDSVTFLKDAQ
jgi:Sulfatase